MSALCISPKCCFCACCMLHTLLNHDHRATWTLAHWLTLVEPRSNRHAIRHRTPMCTTQVATGGSVWVSPGSWCHRGGTCCSPAARMPRVRASMLRLAWCYGGRLICFFTARSCRMAATRTHKMPHSLNASKGHVPPFIKPQLAALPTWHRRQNVIIAAKDPHSASALFDAECARLIRPAASEAARQVGEIQSGRRRVRPPELAVADPRKCWPP